MIVSDSTPQLTDQQILDLVKDNYLLTGQLSDLPSYADLNRKLETKDGQIFVVKIASCQQSPDELDFENQVMQRLNENPELSIQVPQLMLAKETQPGMIKIQDKASRSCWMRVISFLDGELWAKADTEHLGYAASLGKGLAEIDRILAHVQHPASQRYLIWDLKHAAVLINKYLNHVNSKKPVYLIEQVLSQYNSQILPHCAELPVQIIHNDANDYNLLVNSQTHTVTGIFDFGDMVSTYRITELAIAAAYAIMGKNSVEPLIQAMVHAYHQENPLNKAELGVLLHFVQLRLAVSICISSFQYTQTPDNDYLLISQEGAWLALEKLQAIDSVAFNLGLLAACGFADSHNDSEIANLLKFRREHLSENLSVAYQQPLKIVAGKGAYLYDHQGKKYLDMVNNVCHVGHCHPKVVAAGQKQMAVLNTNTRYLHDNIVQFAQQLLETMPAELSVCMFVNSGSEANELALRLARAYTRNKAMIVVEGAYHGNANACIDMSPYKFDGPGGDGAPDWVKQTLVADPFRGKFRGNGADVAENYAADVSRVIEEFSQQGQPICGFICESIQGVGGQVFHPPGYLKLAYQKVREAGGVCIADEVQVGMGRVGTHWWAFQTQDVVPDIITIGKPLGNGHPLAAVVTTQAIAKAFVKGMEYFNTFGGNPVSCAIGTAVLQVVKQENLLQHAQKVGDYLLSGLKQLQQQYPIIGDVRGMGLFIGAEFVSDLVTLAPAVEQIDYVIERLKQEGILLTTEGPLHNVLKIKPPLAFSQSDADYFLKCLKIILQEPAAQI